MKPILEVRNIWKEYKIGGKEQRYLSLRDSLTGFLKPKAKLEKFWALKDVSFDVYEGECVGIIGRNGAGKSTLLKILSRITPPTKGYIKARGRVASLLEVGTGFHPELTGRENIYLNGSILGLRRAEITAKFDEIVDFSGVEKFLDTPLKHYSSGMQLRLAFSVAAYLEPEILLIDEVLAVGDAEFQKKCLGKMNEVSRSGRTVLFVSHDLRALRSICKGGIVIDKGSIVFQDSITSALNHYKRNTVQTPTFVKNKSVLNLKDVFGKSVLAQNENIELKFSFFLTKKIKNPFHFDLDIWNENQQMIIHLRSPHKKSKGFLLRQGYNELSYSIKTPNLLPGKYFLTTYIYDSGGQVFLWIDRVKEFEIVSDEKYWDDTSFNGIRTNVVPFFDIEVD